MRIGILGTGNVARALATGWAAAGHEVVLGSRRPGDRRSLPAPVAGLTGTAERSEVVVNATPGTASLDVLAGIGPGPLAGKPLIDIGVGFTDDGALAHRDVSLGELIQRALPETAVVKTLATVDAEVMRAPGVVAGPSTVFLSGDDAAAKETVGGLLGDLGWPPAARLDLGGIATALGQEFYATLFIGIAGALGTHVFNINVIPRARSQASP
ncbi:NADPH-dependent F420 reductase [Streptomyces radicis]|uniref:Oxidoreductase n=1 Tax=Streptomyces radicis TaxID=1750517 RepID=A0A3A9WG66_9ACTN|nr:NAD(P)-binding domain-containing protein [Streptomyces radicis]RKN12018.1 oxidoreductase [Streptomyces radicis]RKN25931.1 oxidoreductase [Streptomyces radicis]